MMNIYYKIWADLIIRMKTLPQNKNNWKLYSFVFMSMAMSLNLMVLMSVIQKHILDLYFYNFSVDFFPGVKLNAAMKYLILFFLPVAFLNYYFIFYKNKYQKLLKIRKSSNGKLAASYLLTSYFSPFALLLLAYVLNKLL